MSESIEQDPIKEHYRQQAVEHGHEPTSTMADLTTREMELAAIFQCLEHALGTTRGGARLLEIGCGNGYLMQHVRSRHPDLALTGLDYSADMVALAQERQIPNCTFQQGDIRQLSFESSSFDVIVSERCVINVLDRAGQDRSLKELHRVLKPGGHLILIESFVDAFENLNRARTELGLEPNAVPHHNLWFDKAHFHETIKGDFEVINGEGNPASLPPPNFLSSHYFMSRVVYPCITQREVLYNTEFVKFFKVLPPMGYYCPIQLHVLKKK